jgi:O-succinylbenzoate synthase
VKIERLDLRLLRLPLVHFFETSFGRSYDRLFILVTVFGDGVEGWGECVAEEGPFYSSETTETAWHVITEFVAPRVLGVEFPHPKDILPALAAIRGHKMAKAAVEMAAWDLFARQRRQPLARVLGGTRARIESGVSIGIQDSIDQLLQKVETELADGYRRIKIKVKPGWDVNAVDAVRRRFGPIRLMADANAAYALSDGDRLRELDAFDLMMIEQPLGYEDVLEHARLQRGLRTPVCLDESIHDAKTAAEAIELGACRIINVKPGRVGGHAESIALHDVCARRQVPVWHGGMLESGIGRAHNIHLASLPNFSLPGDIAASRRYYVPDLIDPPVEVAPDGTIAVPDGPGIGVSIVMDRVDAATLRRSSLPAHATT